MVSEATSLPSGRNRVSGDGKRRRRTLRNLGSLVRSIDPSKCIPKEQRESPPPSKQASALESVASQSYEEDMALITELMVDDGKKPCESASF